jgi:ferric-dicitrate binding protein FerR (iron transport regulator)
MNRSIRLTEKFLSDERFVSFILTGDGDLGEYWNRYLELHPSEKEAFKEAEQLVRIIRELRPAADSNIIEAISVSGLSRLRESVRNQQGTTAPHGTTGRESNRKTDSQLSGRPVRAKKEPATKTGRETEAGSGDKSTVTGDKSTVTGDKYTVTGDNYPGTGGKLPVDRTRKWYGRSLLYRAAAAAVITAAVLFFFYNRNPLQGTDTAMLDTVTADESSQVRIVLASGASLLPEEMAENEQVSESGSSFIKSSGNRLFYSAGSGDGTTGETEEEQFNTIIVPRGKRITLMLPDSTAVWINSGTELKFPVRFTPQSRTVSLKGEAFFDVAHESHRPFRVRTEALNVEVYGTAFNVSAYGDDESVMTTLVNGKVGIETGTGEKIMLEPDQMADYTCTDGTLTVKSVDVNLYTSWTKGSIIFRDETLESLRPKIERWYNTEVIYKDKAIGDIRLSGIISEEKELDHVMKLIEKACQLSYTITEEGVLLSRNPVQMEINQINILNTNNSNRL